MRNSTNRFNNLGIRRTSTKTRIWRLALTMSRMLWARLQARRARSNRGNNWSRSFSKSVRARNKARWIKAAPEDQTNMMKIICSKVLKVGKAKTTSTHNKMMEVQCRPSNRSITRTKTTTPTMVKSRMMQYNTLIPSSFTRMKIEDTSHLIWHSNKMRLSSLPGRRFSVKNKGKVVLLLGMIWWRCKRCTGMEIIILKMKLRSLKNLGPESIRKIETEAILDQIRESGLQLVKLLMTGSYPRPPRRRTTGQMAENSKIRIPSISKIPNTIMYNPNFTTQQSRTTSKQPTHKEADHQPTKKP